MKSFKIHFKPKQEKSNVKPILVVLKWPTLQDRMKAARITMLQKFIAGNGTAKVACGHLQQLPLYHYQPKPEEDRTKKKIRFTSNESPEEKTFEITGFSPGQSGTGTTRHCPLAKNCPSLWHKWQPTLVQQSVTKIDQ